MTEQDDELFGAKILGIASDVRRAVLLGNEQIAEAIKASTYDDYELESLIEFANLLMRGYDKEYIVGRLQMPSELVERLDKMELNW